LQIKPLRVSVYFYQLHPEGGAGSGPPFDVCVDCDVCDVCDVCGDCDVCDDCHVCDVCDDCDICDVCDDCDDCDVCGFILLRSVELRDDTFSQVMFWIIYVSNSVAYGG
jgi:hypothetical protein